MTVRWDGSWGWMPEQGMAHMQGSSCNIMWTYGRKPTGSHRLPQGNLSRRVIQGPLRCDALCKYRRPSGPKVNMCLWKYHAFHQWHCCKELCLSVLSSICVAQRDPRDAAQLFCEGLWGKTFKCPGCSTLLFKGQLYSEKLPWRAWWKFVFLISSQIHPADNWKCAFPDFPVQGKVSGKSQSGFFWVSHPQQWRLCKKGLQVCEQGWSWSRNVLSWVRKFCSLSRHKTYQNLSLVSEFPRCAWEQVDWLQKIYLSTITI